MAFGNRFSRRVPPKARDPRAHPTTSGLWSGFSEHAGLDRNRSSTSCPVLLGRFRVKQHKTRTRRSSFDTLDESESLFPIGNYGQIVRNSMLLKGLPNHKHIRSVILSQQYQEPVRHKPE